MNNYFILFVLLINTIAYCNIHAQRLLELKDGRKYVGYVKNSEIDEIDFELVSGNSIEIEKQNIQNLRTILVEIQTVDGRLIKGNIIEKSNDTLTVNTGYPYEADIGDAYHIERYRPEIKLSTDSIAMINYGDISAAGKFSYEKDDFYRKAHTFFGGSVGSPGGLNLIYGHIYTPGVGFRISGGFIPAQNSMVGAEAEFCYLIRNEKNFQFDVSFGPGFMLGEIVWAYGAFQVSMNAYGFYGKLGISFGDGAISNSYRSLSVYTYTDSDYDIKLGSPQILFQMGYVFRFN